MTSESVGEFYRAMRELESLVGSVQQQLVAQKILFTQGTVSSIRVNACEADIVAALAGTEVQPVIGLDLSFSHMREAAIGLIRKAESLLMIPNPEMQRVVVTVEFLALLETVDIIIANFMGRPEKVVSRKFGPCLKLFLPPNS